MFSFPASYVKACALQSSVGMCKDDHSSLYRDDDIADRAQTGIKKLLAELWQRRACCMLQLGPPVS